MAVPITRGGLKLIRAAKRRSALSATLTASVSGGPSVSRTLKVKG